MGFKKNKDGSVAGGWSEQDVRTLCNLAGDTAARLGAAMRSGEVRPRPAARACEYCEYSAFCQRQIDPPVPAAKMSRSDVRAALENGKETDNA